MAESDFESALRYRNMAEQTRIAAGGAITRSARDRLLKTAADYEALAEMYESKFRKQTAESRCPRADGRPAAEPADPAKLF